MAITADREALKRYYREAAGIKKAEPRKRAKDRERRFQRDITKEVRAYVFGRERGRCRCCAFRLAESMHEITFRSKGKEGQPSRKNSIAVCGKLVGEELCCHTLLQQHQIQVTFDPKLKAEGDLTFTPITERAKEWMRLGGNASLLSPPQRDLEDGPSLDIW